MFSQATVGDLPYLDFISVLSTTASNPKVQSWPVLRSLVFLASIVVDPISFPGSLLGGQEEARP